MIHPGQFLLLQFALIPITPHFPFNKTSLCLALLQADRFIVRNMDQKRFSLATTVIFIYLTWLFSFLHSQANVKAITVPPEKTVELAIFIDQYLYNHWALIVRSLLRPISLQEFIQSYLDVLLESLNLIYAHPSLRSTSLSGGAPIIGFHLTHTQLLWRGDDAYAPDLNWRQRNSASTSAPNYLETFCDFANKANWGGIRWDHALLLTGVDLNFINGTNYGVAGISWDNSMCNRTYSCSIVEGKTFRSVMTAVHEIGHSFGIEHDGLKYNFKCPPRGYIMSYSGGGEMEDDNNPVGKIAWSHCSTNNLKAFLSTAPNVLSNQVACLNNNPVETSSSMRSMRGLNEGSLAPGQMFTIEEQCRMGGGEPSTRKRHVRKMCLMLHCNNTARGEVLPLHPALEGTPCGRYKVCKFGECTSTISRPPLHHVDRKNVKPTWSLFPSPFSKLYSNSK